MERVRTLAGTALTAAAAAALAGCAARGGVGRLGVRADVREAPRTVPTTRGRLAVYEVEVRNTGEREVRLDAWTRRRPGGEETLDGAALALRVVTRRRVPDVAARLVLPAAERAVVLAEADLAGDEAPPLFHDVAVSAQGADGVVRETVAASELAIDATAPVVLGAPLAGGRWLVENGPETVSGHRHAVVWIRGRPRAAQRFAVDFFRVGDDRRTFAGDPRSCASYHAFGAEVLAVAAAGVVAAVDGIPDNAPDATARAVEMSNETICGNHVVLDLGAGRFAVYAHLQNGSVAVRAGDRVAAGQTLGRLGNSGNSTEPHLHLHVADAASPVDASGLPFVFDAFVADGAQAAGVLPAEGSIVDFGARPSQVTMGVQSDRATR